MTRRRQQGKQHAKRAQKAAHERLESLSGTYIPDRTDKRTKQWDTAYDDANTLRIQFNTSENPFSDQKPDPQKRPRRKTQDARGKTGA